MYLNRKDIEKINAILEKFLDIDVFKIEQDNSSGIGSVTVVTFDQNINDTKGSFQIEISGEEDW